MYFRVGGTNSVLCTLYAFNDDHYREPDTRSAAYCADAEGPCMDMIMSFKEKRVFFKFKFVKIAKNNLILINCFEKNG